jgi:hypothetical protein
LKDLLPLIHLSVLLEGYFDAGSCKKDKQGNWEDLLLVLCIELFYHTFEIAFDIFIDHGRLNACFQNPACSLNFVSLLLEACSATLFHLCNAMLSSNRAFSFADFLIEGHSLVSCDNEIADV